MNGPLGDAGQLRQTGERLAAQLLEQLRCRLALLRVEVAEEKVRIGRLFAWGMAALFLSGLTVVLAVLWVVAMYWDTPHRVTAIIATTLIVAAAAAGAWLRLRRELYTTSPLFESSLAELRKDMEVLNREP